MYEESAKRMSVAVKHLALLLLPVVIVVSVVGIPNFVYGDEKAKPEIEIKKISSLGNGPEKIKIPHMKRTVYIIGSSEEKVFTVKIKNNTKKEKRDVKVKFSAYDKKGELIGEKSPYNLRALYADEGYLFDDGILHPRKSVRLYFAVYKKAKYVKAELFCGDEIVDVDTWPSSFPERLK